MGNNLDGDEENGIGEKNSVDISSFLSHELLGKLLKPQDHDGLFKQGFFYFSLGEYGKSIEIFTEAIGMNPQHFESFFYRGNSYQILEKYQQAIEDFSKIIELRPNHVEGYYNRGISLYDSGEPSRAISDFSFAITLNPESEIAYKVLMSRGNCLGDIGFPNEALQDYDQCVVLEPDNPEAYYARGMQYNNMEEFDNSLQDYDKAIELNESYSAAYLNRGTVHMRLRKIEKAIDDFTMSIKHTEGGQNADGYLNRGFCHYELKDLDRSFEDISKSYDISSTLNKPLEATEALIFRGIVQMQRGNEEKAGEDVETAITSRTRTNLSFKSLSFLGFYFGDNGDLVNSQKYFKMAVDANPNFSDTYCNRSRVLCDMDPTRSLEDWGRFVQVSSPIDVVNTPTSEFEAETALLGMENNETAWFKFEKDEKKDEDLEEEEYIHLRERMGKGDISQGFPSSWKRLFCNSLHV